MSDFWIDGDTFNKFKVIGVTYILWAVLASTVAVLFMGQTWARWRACTPHTRNDSVLLLMIGITTVALGSALARTVSVLLIFDSRKAALMMEVLDGHWEVLFLSATSMVLGYSLHLHSALKGTWMELHPATLLGTVCLVWATVLAVVIR